MAKISPMYHYCTGVYEVGDTIPAGDDSYLSELTAQELAMEKAIRERSCAVGKIRDSCVYTYENKTLAETAHWMRQRQLRRKVPDITLLLYVVEIDTEDLLYVADLNHFTNGEEAFAREDEQALADAVKGYLSGLAADGYDKTKWEFLASKVSVKHAVGPPPRTRPHV